jgi:hypothetical protein
MSQTFKIGSTGEAVASVNEPSSASGVRANRLEPLREIMRIMVGQCVDIIFQRQLCQLKTAVQRIPTLLDECSKRLTVPAIQDGKPHALHHKGIWMILHLGDLRESPARRAMDFQKSQAKIFPGARKFRLKIFVGRP